MSRRVKNAMVPHVARWRGQNACLFTFAVRGWSTKDNRRKARGLFLIFSQLGSCFWPFASIGTQLITQITNDDNVATPLRGNSDRSRSEEQPVSFNCTEVEEETVPTQFTACFKFTLRTFQRTHALMCAHKSILQGFNPHPCGRKSLSASEISWGGPWKQQRFTVVVL